MNKNRRKNAFYFFERQFKETNAGKVFNKGITDISAAAADSWKRMTLQQREPFEDLAKKDVATNRIKANKNESSKTNESRFDEKAETIKRIVRQSVVSGTLKTQEYYFIAGNIFCQTLLNKYYPAELALIKFTLEDGVIQTYHTYINPETIPIGYRFDAAKWADETHWLPIPPEAKGEANFAVILEEINKFISCTEKTIPLFTLEENIPMIESFIEEFCLAAENINRFEILSLNQLFFNLKNDGASIDCRSRFNRIDDATVQLTRVKFMYLNQIACQFHEENDRSRYCCLSAVKRWAYIISENICTDLKITLVAGKHFPNIADSHYQLIQHNDQHSEFLKSATPANRTNSHDDRQFDLNVACGADSYSLHSLIDSFDILDVSLQESNSSISTDFSELDRLREGNCFLDDNFGKSPLNNRGRTTRGRSGRISLDQRITRGVFNR